MKKLVVLICLLIFMGSCKTYQYKDLKTPKITIQNGQFLKGKQAYYFVGANYWYGPLIAAKNIGDRERLLKELDVMDSLGIDNLRILVGAEGGTEDFQVKPALQPEQGKYNEDLLDGLDFLLAEMAKREMYAVLYLNNNWIWSGGMSAYLAWNGYGEVQNPFTDKYTWEDYFNYTQQFHTCMPCREAFQQHIKFILGRTNNYSGRKYTEDHTIMSWQVANEPRIFTESDREPFQIWLNETVELLEKLAPNTLISTGAEGKASYLQEIDTYQMLHSHKHIDYLTMHMWPKNWNWYDVNHEETSTLTSIEKANNYIDEHIQVAKNLNKPIVISEFGFPREKESLLKKASLKNRNQFYQAIFKRLEESYQEQNVLGGVNFWGFAGYANTNQQRGKWEIGDDFSADPPQEPQGLNSVFATDTSTLNLIYTYNRHLNNL